MEGTQSVGETVVGVTTAIGDMLSGLGYQAWRPFDWAWETGNDCFHSGRDWASRTGKAIYDDTSNFTSWTYDGTCDIGSGILDRTQYVADQAVDGLAYSSHVHMNRP